MMEPLKLEATAGMMNFGELTIRPGDKIVLKLTKSNNQLTAERWICRTIWENTTSNDIKIVGVTTTGEVIFA